jgi:hypothetical protein
MKAVSIRRRAGKLLVRRLEPMPNQSLRLEPRQQTAKENGQRKPPAVR